MFIQPFLLVLVATFSPIASDTTNYAPDTWFAGPDLSVFDARFGWSEPPRSLDIADWMSLPDLSGSVLSCDSLTVLPHERAAHKTFFEIYGNRLFVRSENDTVHMNSWILVHGGGSDADSPYLVQVDPSDPALADTLSCASQELAVIRPTAANGSPIGFRVLSGQLLDPAGPYAIPAQGPLFPVFDPASVFRTPTVGGYRAVQRSGKVYLALRAQDGDGLLDPDISGAQTARTIADHVDGGTGTPQEIALRHKILTFYVNKAPFLKIDDPAFVPKPNEQFMERTFDLNLLADDADPFDYFGGSPPPGGPTSTKVLRWNVTLSGFDSGGQPISFTLPGPYFAPQILVTVPNTFADRNVTVEVELCDCANCPMVPGQGRCVTTSIPIEVEPDITTSTLASLIEADASSERVRLTWQLGIDASAWVERRETDTPWQELGEAEADGERVSYEDPTVSAGRRYDYRLAIPFEGRTLYAGQVSIETPIAAVFALEGVSPNPSRGARRVLLSLSSSTAARLEIYDMSGRRLATQALGRLGAGRHQVEFDPSLRLPTGLYWLRLTQGVRSSAVRFVALD